MKKSTLVTSSGLFLVSFGLFATQAAATGFLPQEARGMAMGGTGVAIGNSRQAHYYNPSLLVNAPEDQDFNFEVDFAIRLSDSDNLIESASDFADADPVTGLATSIEALSATQASDFVTDVAGVNAKLDSVVDNANLLQASIRSVTNKSFSADINVGSFVSVPNGKIGWAAYVNAWGNMGIQGKLASTDDSVMTDLIKTGVDLQNAIISGTPFDPTSAQTLADIDPTDTLNSSLSIIGGGVREFGVALATKQNINNYDVNIGVTPKIQMVTTFGVEKKLKELEDEITITDQNDPKSFTSFNLDIGISKVLNEQWATGLMIKNLIPYSYDVNGVSSQKVEISPAARIGVAWRYSRLSAAADLDLTKNKDIASLTETQFLALGAELDIWLLQLRGGYRQNLAGSGGSGPSLGLGLYLGGLNLDTAVASNTVSAAGLAETDNLNFSAQLGLNW